MDKKRMVVKPVSRIGGLIPKNRVILVTGLPGTGKSYSTVKFLNEHGVVPLYFNLDHTEIGSLKADMFSMKDMVDLFDTKNEYKDLAGRVVIFDTYTRMEDCLDYRGSEMVDVLEALVEGYDITIIVIGHPEDYVGKDSIFKDNPALIRSCYEHIHLEQKQTSSTKKGVTVVSQANIMYIKKGRGLKGERVIHDWMRG